MNRLRVLCVDDHQVVLEGIASIIAREPDLEVASVTGRGEEAVALFQRHRPDVTIVDLELPGMSGVEVIRAIRDYDPSARIVVLTMHLGEEDIYRALQAGAASYVLKDALFTELVQMVRRVGAGERPLPFMVAAILAGRADHEELTAREVRILELLARGVSNNKDIAVELGIAEQTTKVHFRNLFAKLKVSDRTEALSVALQRGIIHLK